MSVGLVALLDDVAALAKVAAASVDDVAGQAAKAGAKAAGVVVDDTAVTPRYVVGFAASRELPIVRRIALGSLRNKLLFLLPAALALSLLAPWAVTPLLMAGGLFLCYEGAEKVLETFFPHAAHEHEAETGQAPDDPVALENERVTGAIRTDFILSAEIMAITLATVADAPVLTQGVVLAIVGLGITVLVYGLVALIVRADDLGVALAARAGPGDDLQRAAGLGLVRAMPPLLKGLAAVGTAAMVWVGGGILLHGLAAFGFDGPEQALHALAVAAAHAAPAGHAVVEAVAFALGAGAAGVLAGAAAVPLVAEVVVPVGWGLRTLRG